MVEKGINLVRYFAHWEDGSSRPSSPEHAVGYFDALKNVFNPSAVRYAVATEFLEPVPGSGQLDPVFMQTFEEELNWLKERNIKVLLGSHKIGFGGDWPPQDCDFFENTVKRDNWISWWQTVLAWLNSKNFIPNPVYGIDSLNEPLAVYYECSKPGTPEEFQQKYNTYYDLLYNTIHPQYPGVAFIGGTYGLPTFHVYYKYAQDYTEWGPLYQQGKYVEGRQKLYEWLNAIPGNSVIGEVGIDMTEALKPHCYVWLRDILSYATNRNQSWFWWHFASEHQGDDPRFACTKQFNPGWPVTPEDFQEPNESGLILQEYLKITPIPLEAAAVLGGIALFDALLIAYYLAWKAGLV